MAAEDRCSIGLGSADIHDTMEENQRIAMQSWSWKRPVMQSSKARINVYNRYSIIKLIKKELQTTSDVYQQFVESCFGHFMDFRTDSFSCNAALHALMTHEITGPDALEDEIWFQIGERCIRFSQYEYALVSGLRFGESTFNPNEAHDPPATGVHMRCLRGEIVLLDTLRVSFEAGQFRHSPVDALKVAKVLLLYFMLLGQDGRQTSVDHWVWTLVEDTERWESFPWGNYTFDFLIRYIQNVPVTLPPTTGDRLPGYHFYGFSTALLVWAYEAIPTLGNKCAQRVSQTAVPRCLRWRSPKSTLDFSGFFTNELECAATLVPTIDEQRQSYWQSLGGTPPSIQVPCLVGPIRRSRSTIATSTANAPARGSQRARGTTGTRVRGRKRVRTLHSIRGALAVSGGDRVTSARGHPEPTLEHTTEVAHVLDEDPMDTTGGDGDDETSVPLHIHHVYIDTDEAPFNFATGAGTDAGQAGRDDTMDAQNVRDVCIDPELGLLGQRDGPHVSGVDSSLIRLIRSEVASVIQREVPVVVEREVLLALERHVPSIIQRELRHFFSHMDNRLLFADEQPASSPSSSAAPVTTPVGVTAPTTDVDRRPPPVGPDRAATSTSPPPKPPPASRSYVSIARDPISDPPAGPLEDPRCTIVPDTPTAEQTPLDHQMAEQTPLATIHKDMTIQDAEQTQSNVTAAVEFVMLSSSDDDSPQQSRTASAASSPPISTSASLTAQVMMPALYPPSGTASSASMSPTFQIVQLRSASRFLRSPFMLFNCQREDATLVDYKRFLETMEPFSEGVVASYNHSHKKHLVVYSNGIEEMLNLRKHMEPAEDVSADQAQKAHSPACGLSSMLKLWNWGRDGRYADDEMDAHLHVRKKRKGQPFDLKTCSASPILSKDQRIPKLEADIAPIDSKLSSIPGDDGLLNVNGYKVKSSTAPILEAIFAKYGDITARCKYKSTSVRASLLEAISDDVRKLQHPDFEAILSDVEIIENEVSDVEASKIDVSWLREHLAQLHKIVLIREKRIELRKTKAKSGIVTKAAANELKERHAELLLAQGCFKEAEKRVNALRLVSRKIDDEIMQSESEEYSWRRRLDDLL